jgi:hypothetical protein
MKETLGSYLFEYFNIIEMAKNNQQVLKEENVIKKLVFFMKLNEMLATGVGTNYSNLLNIINTTMNQLYLYYSVEITTIVNQQGKNVLNFMTVKAMRMVKR